MEDFKSRLARLMKEKNFNNSSLGRELEKVPSTVKKWVDGEGMPELKVIDQLAEILAVTPAYLLYGIDELGKSYNIITTPPAAVAEVEATYGISKDELIEFFKWKAEKAKFEAESAIKQVDRLKSDKVDAN